MSEHEHFGPSAYGHHKLKTMPSFLEKALNTGATWLLEPDQTRVLVQHYFSDPRMSIVEIAKNRGESKSNVSRIENEALKRLQEIVDSQYVGEPDFIIEGDGSYKW